MTVLARVGTILVLLGVLAAPAVAEPETPAIPPGWAGVDSSAPPEPVVRLRSEATRVGPSRPSRGFARVADPFQIARGPAEIRDEFLTAQVRLTLPAVGPDVLDPGRWLVRMHVDYGNDFGFSQVGSDLRFMVDGEHSTLEAQVRRGLGGGVDVGVRVPVRWRGGGWADGLIEWWHDTFGFANNDRDSFPQDEFHVEGRDVAYNEYEWTEKGWGLGNVELDVRWAFLCPSRRCDWRAALVGRVGLPTGTGPYETSSVDVGLQAVAARQLGRRFDLYGGLGGTWFSEDTIRGIEYEPLRAHGFLALEWRAASWLSLLVQTDAASRLVTNLVDYPALQWYLMVGGKADLGRGWRATLGVTENLLDQQSTLDAGIWASLEVVF